MISSKRALLLPLLCSVSHSVVQGDSLTGVGGIFPDFTLPDFKTEELIQREDFAGGILVIDFCASWCGPCQISTPGLKELIEAYYLERGGNPLGIPVHLVSILDASDSRVASEVFVSSLHLDRVLLDNAEPRLYSLMPETGSIPYFAIINGVADDPLHEQWELLYVGIGFSGNEMFVDEMRPIIDSVSGTPPGASPAFYREPAGLTVREGSGAEFSLGYTGAAPFIVRWYHNNELIPNETGNALIFDAVTVDNAGVYYAEVKNDLGLITSREARLVVKQRFDDWARLAALSGDDGLPDADPDQDGQSNLVEYVQGTDPSDPLAYYFPTMNKTGDTDAYKVDFQVSSAAFGVDYGIETSADLSIWSPIDSGNVVLTDLMSSRQLFSVTYPAPLNDLFWRLKMVDSNLDLVLREGQPLFGELTEADKIVPRWLELYGEVYYYDKYSLRGLEDGVEYSVKFETVGYDFSPYLELIDPSTGESLAATVANAATSDNFLSIFTFIAEASRDYVFYASTYNTESTGSYKISVERTSDFTPFVYGTVENSTLSENDHYSWDDFYALAHTYSLHDLPIGQEVTMSLQTDQLSETVEPFLELRMANTLHRIRYSRVVESIPGEEEKLGVLIRFIPSAEVDYLATVSTVSAVYPNMTYTLSIDQTDLIPAIRKGDSISAMVNRTGTWTFDENSYNIDFYKLTEAEADLALQIEASSIQTADIRLFVFDAATWNLVFKDPPNQVGQNVSSLLMPLAGKNYFIGIGIPAGDEVVEYTLSLPVPQ